MATLMTFTSTPAASVEHREDACGFEWITFRQRDDACQVYATAAVKDALRHLVREWDMAEEAETRIWPETWPETIAVVTQPTHRGELCPTCGQELNAYGGHVIP